MKKLIVIYLVALLLLPCLLIGIVSGSDTSAARYYGIITVTNNSTASTIVSTNISGLNTPNMITQGWLNSSANNCAIQYSGSDIPFMPGYGTNPWTIFTNSIGANSQLSYTLYTDSATGGSIAYFPGATGMAVSDNDTYLEPSANFSISMTGYIDTSAISGKIDFTTFTEVDVPGKITVSESTITAVDVDNDETIYDYKDYGVGFFDELDIDVTVSINSTSHADGLVSMGLANLVGNMNDFGTTEVGIWLRKSTGISLYRGKLVAGDTYAAAADTPYYLTIIRPAGNDTVTCKVYSDAARATLVDTLTLAGFGTTKWRYGYGFISYNSATAGTDFDGYFKDLSFIVPPVNQPILVYKPAAFASRINGTGNITSSITGGASVSVSGVASGNHTVYIEGNGELLGSGVDGSTESHLPFSNNFTGLALNLPLWSTYLQGSPITSVDSTPSSTTVTGTTWTNTGRTLNGVSDFLAIPSYTLAHGANWTVSWWFYPQVNVVDNCVLGSAGDSRLEHRASNTISLYTATGAFAGSVTLGSDIRNRWINMVVSSDGVNISFYEDKVPRGALTPASASIAISQIGKGGSGLDWGQGIIGELQVYNSKVFSQSEVNAQYDNTKWRYDGTADTFEYRYSGIAVPNTTSNWTFMQGNSMPYLEYMKIYVGGALKGSWAWEYGATFTDLSGNNQTATPSFRTTASDADVSAALTYFAPVAQARAPAFAVGTGPLWFSGTVTVSGNFTTGNVTRNYPGRALIESLSTATSTPSQLPATIISGFVILALSLTTSAFLRQYGTASIFVKIIVLAAGFGIAIALNIFDFWMMFFLGVFALFVLFGSKEKQS